jgi:hypothetical protein
MCEPWGMQIYFSLLIALIGLLAYYICTRPESKEIGRVSYFAGLLAFLLTGVQKAIEIIGR